MASAFVPVFRATTREACDDRAFVLSALRIPADIVLTETGYTLSVPSPQAALASHHLWQYERELGERRRMLPEPVAPRMPFAWVGSVVYMLVLVIVALAVSRDGGPQGPFLLGDLDAARVQAGEGWRAVTALTLHVDVVHLVSNLAAGAVFGHLASRQWGGGRAWLLIVWAAGFANFIEAWLAEGSHRSVGASTAVFAALGLLAAHVWRTRRHLPQHWARRWAPLVAGVVVLGLLGTAGEGTNLVAHALGFVMGCAAGAAVSQPRAASRLQVIPQWAAGLLALATVLGAWGLALTG